jgi:hypothetical protein
MRRKPSSQHTAVVIPSDLTETERDLFSHLQDGYELETDSLGGDPLLRRRKDHEVIKPLSATRNTVEGLEKRGLIIQGKGADPLRIVWRLNESKRVKQSQAKRGGKKGVVRRTT